MTPFHPPTTWSTRTLLKNCYLALLGVLLVSAGTSAWAEPSVRAGRIATVKGTVWLFEPNTRAWRQVLPNQLVGQGDHVRTAPGSRIALQMGTSTVWLNEQSDLNISRFEDSATLLRLFKGDLAIRMRTQEAANETRIQTNEGVTTPEMAGLIRVGQNDRGTRVAVEKGRAQFNSDPAAAMQRAWLSKGEQADFSWSGSSTIGRRSIGGDAFGDWFLAQDEAYERFAFADGSFVSPEMIEAEELRQNGEWSVAEEYGNRWVPNRVAPGWEPYRDGRWVWAPGRVERNPAYAPAVVPWLGGPQVRTEIHGARRPPPSQWSPMSPRHGVAPIDNHSARFGERFRKEPDTQNQRRDDRHNKPSAPQLTPPQTIGQTPPLPRFEVPLFNRGGRGSMAEQPETRPAPSVSRPPVVAPIEQARAPVAGMPVPQRQRPDNGDEEGHGKFRHNKGRDRIEP